MKTVFWVRIAWAGLALMLLSGAALGAVGSFKFPAEGYSLGAIAEVGQTGARRLQNVSLTHSCELQRTGAADVTVSLQGSFSGAVFTNITGPHVVSPTDTDTHALDSIGYPALYVRGRCASGCDVSNTVAFTNCVSGGGSG